MTPTEAGSPALPPEARLLHIGLAKTGTTALQSTAATHRDGLLEHGVLYPGRHLNHRSAVSALMGRRWGWQGLGASVPPMKHWDRLLAEVEAETERRIWISHEFVSESDDATAQRFADALGQRLHIVITLRPFASILASSWQQYLKGGTRHTFEHWLRRVLADPPDLKTTPSFHRRNNQGEVVTRWANAVGRDHLTVVIVDKAQPTLLTDSFEDMLDLPRGFLVDSSLGGHRANRTMSVPESELLRQLNLAIQGHQVHWRQYETLIRGGAVARMLEGRIPGEDEPRLQLPRWAATVAQERGERFADQIAASGVRVVGDLDTLRTEPTSVETLPDTPNEVPLDLASEAVTGLLSAAIGRRAFFDEVKEVPEEQLTDRQRAERALSTTTTRELAGVLGSRVRRKVLRTINRKDSR